MRRRHDRLLARSVSTVALVSTFVIAPCLAHAASEVDRETVRLEVRAPSECPTRTEIEARLVRAAPQLRPGDETASRRFVIDIDASGRRGRLVTESEGGGPSGTREVEGDDCDEVIDQLALATSLAVAPRPASTAPPLPPSRAPRLADPKRDAAAEESPSSSAWDHDEIAFGVSSGPSTDHYGRGIYASAELLYRAGPLVVGVVGDLCGNSQRYWGGGAAIGITAPLPSWFRIDLLGTLGAHNYPPIDRAGLEPRTSSAIAGFVGGRAKASFEVAHLAVGVSATAETDLARITSSSAINTRFAWGPFVGGTFGL